MEGRDENYDVSMEDMFDFENGALPPEYAGYQGSFTGYAGGATQQAFHSARQPEGGTRNDQDGSALQHQVQGLVQTGPDADGRHFALIQRADGTTALAVQDSRGMTVLVFPPVNVGVHPNHSVFALPVGFPILTWSFIPPIHGQSHQIYQWHPQQIPNQVDQLPSPVASTGHPLPQLQTKRYAANRSMIAGCHRGLWKRQPPGSNHYAVELEGTSVTVHDLASQLTSLLPTRYIAVQNIPFSPTSYVELRQYVHPIEFKQKSLLEAFMGGSPDSVFFACTVVEPGDYRSVAMGRVEKGSRYPLFRPREGYLYFQIRDLAVLPGRPSGVGGWVIASLLFAVVQFVPREAMFEVIMMVPESLRSWCEGVPGIHRGRDHTNNQHVFIVRGQKL